MTGITGTESARCPTTGTVGILISLGCVLLWYTFSIGLTFYNKWLFNHYGLHFPLTVTSVHMVSNFLLAWLCRASLFRWTGNRRPLLDAKAYFQGAVPTGASSALDIGLSNTAILYINITTYTICKSTSIIFLLLFAFCFRVERPSFALLGVIVTISLGVILFTYGGEAEYNVLGLVLVMTATVMAGLRWVLTQLLLQHKQFGLHNPIDTLYHVTPVMAAVLLPLALIFEGTAFFSSHHIYMGDEWSPYRSCLVMGVGALIAFAMNVSEFLLISRTSSVTLSVAGIMKELLTILLSVVVFSETLNSMNVLGLFITIGGIVIFNIIKYRQMQAKALSSKHGSISSLRSGKGSSRDRGDGERLMGSSESNDDDDDVLFEMQAVDRADGVLRAR